MKFPTLAAAMAERYEREQAQLIRLAIAATLRKLGQAEIVLTPADLATLLDGVEVQSETREDGAIVVRLIEPPNPEQSG